MERPLKSCEHCGAVIRKESNRNWNQYAKKRFCSRACSAASQSRKQRCTCAGCGVEFQRSPSHLRSRDQFCSHACRRKRITKPCEVCGTLTEKIQCNIYAHWYCSMRCQGLAKLKHDGQSQGRRSPEDLAWKKAVINAGGYKCAMCGTDRRLEAHHIKPIKDFPRLRHDKANGLCVCHQCHYYGIHGGMPNFIHGRYAKKTGD